MRREQYQTLKNWKEKKNKKPMIIFGARQVGKTYLVQEFAKDNYEYFYTINFEFEKEALDIFSGNLDIKTLLIQLSSYQPNVPIIEGKTLIFFDEVQKCPQVLTALKSFALDGRFDVIASGSMLGIIMHEVSSYPVGYVETMHMKPMSFKEFLWANGLSEENIEEDVDYHLQLQLNKIFDSIPSQHARETDTLKFKYSDVKKAVELTNLKNHLSGLKRKASIMKIKKNLAIK